MFVFQIGFNKTATSAFFRLFNQSGHNSLHSGGRFWRLRNHPQLMGVSPQQKIAENIAEAAPPVQGLDDFQAFFDMEYVDKNQRIENFLNFDHFARHYPTAKFILNTRNMFDWIKSRVRHHDGLYIQMEMDRTGETFSEIIHRWRTENLQHCDRVREFFKQEQDRLIEFNIDTGDIETLARFVSPDFDLKLAHWSRVRVTDTVAAKKGWSDTWLAELEKTYSQAAATGPR